MHRTKALIGAATLLALTGCARASIPEKTALDACSAGEEPLREDVSRGGIPLAAPPWGEVIGAVDVRGSKSLPRASITEVMALRAGATLDAARADDDTRAIFALGIFEDVRLSTERDRRSGAMRLVVEVVERPVLRRVVHAGASSPPVRDRWTAPVPGDVYDPAAIARSKQRLLTIWEAEGKIDGRVAIRSRSPAPGIVDLCVVAREGPAWTVGAIELPGASPAIARALREVMRTADGKFNVAGKPYRADLAEESRMYFFSALYERGMLSADVGLPAIERRPGRALAIVIPIVEGPVYHTGSLRVTGKLAGPPDAYLRALGVARGELFTRSRMMGAMDRVRAHHLAITGREASIEPETTLRKAEGLVDLVFIVKEGS